MLFFWPVLITQIWGIVQQSKLDDKALEIAEEVLKNRDSFTTLNLDINGMVFCTNCGLMNKIVKASSKDYKNNKGKILDNSIVIMKMT